MISNILISFFKKLNKNNIHYAVLRNGHKLPYDYGRDIDIFINKNDLTLFEKVIEEIIDQYNLNIIFKANRYAFKSFYLQNKKNSLSEIIPIDIWTSLHWRSFEFIKSEIILANENLIQISEFNIKHTNRIIENYIKFAKGSLQNKNLKKKYFESLEEHIRDNHFDLLLKKNLPILSSVFIKKLSTYYFSNNQKKLKQTFRFFLVINLLNNPFKNILSYLKFIKGWIFQFNQGPGTFIAFVGPDGSGKSSLINEISNRKLPFSNFIYRHGRFKILPNLSTIFFKNNRDKIDRESIQDQVNIRVSEFSSMPSKKYSNFKTFIYLSYYLIDFILGFFWLYYHRGVGNIVVLDRYIYDYFILKEYEKFPRSILKFIFKIIPKPNCLFILNADPEIIFKRKPELTQAEIKRQQTCCKDLNKIVDSSVLLNTDIDFDKTLSIMYNKIFLSK